MQCCVCLEEKDDLALPPCCGRSSASIRFCHECLERCCLSRSACPACRSALVWKNGTALVKQGNDEHDVEPFTAAEELLCWLKKTAVTLLYFCLKPLDSAFQQALEAAFSRGHV